MSLYRDLDSDVSTTRIVRSHTYNVYRGSSPGTQNRLEVSKMCEKMFFLASLWCLLHMLCLKFKKKSCVRVSNAISCLLGYAYTPCKKELFRQRTIKYGYAAFHFEIWNYLTSQNPIKRQFNVNDGYQILECVSLRYPWLQGHFKKNILDVLWTFE